MTDYNSRRRFVEYVINSTFNCTLDQLPDRINGISDRELMQLTKSLAESWENDLVRLSNWRPHHHSKRGIPLLRWILSQVGIKLSSQQVMRDGKRFMIYYVEVDDI